MPTKVFYKNMKLYGDCFKGLLSGGACEVPSPAAHYEPVEGQIFDVGVVVRAYSKAWIGVAPNQVTPANLRDLMLFLDDFTVKLEEADIVSRTQLQGPLTGGPGEVLIDCDELGSYGRAGLIEPCLELQRWRTRLDEYQMQVNLVPPEQDFDREATLWTVTAPLFLGWYGGPEGTDPLVEGGFNPGFSADLQHAPDIGTVYRLANSYGIEKAWEKKRREMFIDDIVPDLPEDTLSDLKKLLLYTAVGAAGLIVLNAVIRR